MEQRKRIRPYPPVIAVILLFAAVLAFSVVHTAREANRAGDDRTSQMVATALTGEVDHMVMIAEDNAQWDEAARAVYGPQVNYQFLWNAWGVSTSEAKNFAAVAVVDHAGKTLGAFRRGRAVHTELRKEFGRSIDALIAKAKSSQAAVGGVVSTPKGLMIVGVSPIFGTSAAIDELTPSHDYSSLILAQPIDQAKLTELSRQLLVNNLKLSPTGADQNSVPITDPNGKAIAALVWQSSNIGFGALWIALPMILFACILHILFAAVIVSRAFHLVKRLQSDAMIDSLSNLPNRRALRINLSVRLARDERLALAMIDLDGFKTINDNFGHAVGDRLIKSVAELLVDVVGDEGMVARLGGDEFAILLNGSACVSRIEKLSQTILGHLSRPFRIDERTVLVGASIGLASASLSESDASEFMRHADVAMYTAKRSGKMRLCWYDENLDQRQATARTIETELRASIESGSFDLVYQPVLSAANQHIVGAEALLRWVSPTRGDVGPAEFVPIAEETGLIDRIGMIALRRACTDGLAWPSLTVSINISAAQLRNPDFVAHLGAVIAETGFPGHRLMLEITDSYLLYDPENATKVIVAIKALGVGVAIDDFGTGRASIAFLRSFNIDRIKLDRSLVAEACTTATGLVLVNAITTMARTLCLSVCAEGIEAHGQAEMMHVAGCDQLQGWYFSRALSAHDITERLKPTSQLRLIGCAG